MTQSTFTPPMKFPAKYKQWPLDVTLYGLFEVECADGSTEVRYIGVWLHHHVGEGTGMWSLDGHDYGGGCRLEDIPKEPERVTVCRSVRQANHTLFNYKITYDAGTGDNPTIEKVDG